MRNYLRVRGEYLEQGFSPGTHEELPPRARRIPYKRGEMTGFGGTTSACAENTGLVSVLFGPGGNYLRVRGEYMSLTTVAIVCWELPPRARRIRHSIG